MAITIRDEISGQPVIIERLLLPRHIKVNQLLWYNGFTSVGQWDCPAIITQVDERKKQFRIRSLDDMFEQHSWYPFSTSKGPDNGRNTMRLVERDEVKAYLAQQKTNLAQSVANERASLREAENKLQNFETVLATLAI